MSQYNILENAVTPEQVDKMQEQVKQNEELLKELQDLTQKIAELNRKYENEKRDKRWNGVIE